MTILHDSSYGPYWSDLGFKLEVKFARASGGAGKGEVGTNILSFDKKKEKFQEYLQRWVGSLGQQYFNGHKLLLIKKEPGSMKENIIEECFDHSCLIFEEVFLDGRFYCHLSLFL